MYHEKQPFPVYDEKVWWGDDWDPMDYGQDFDFNRPFFDQLLELKNKTPHFSVFTIGGTLENSEFNNCAGYIKNCYLISEGDYNEDCAYSNRIYHSKNIIDCTNCYACELCYECIDCKNCHSLKYSEECENCHDSLFLKNCIGCKDCIGCINQRHKQYMIKNQKYSKEEYEKIKENLKLETLDGINDTWKKVLEFFLSQPQKAVKGEHNENVIGDSVYDSKNAFYCFDCRDLEDCRYCAKLTTGIKNCMDFTAWGFKAELVYQSAACGDNAYNLKFCSTCTTSNSNLEYCSLCTSSSDLFGCISLKKKKYCILNKQYSKENFQILRKKIIEHMEKTKEWGQFFPKNFSGFGYNETTAMDNFPLTKEHALAKGFTWCDYEMPLTEVEKTIQANSLPKTIAEVSDDILKWAIVCEKTKKPFKITQQELSFYRLLNIPCPRIRPDQRHANRMGKCPRYRLQKSKCGNCKKDIFKNIRKDQPETVLCEECYLKATY
jgi:hypothetical protein